MEGALDGEKFLARAGLSEMGAADSPLCLNLLKSSRFAVSLRSCIPTDSNLNTLHPDITSYDFLGSRPHRRASDR